MDEMITTYEEAVKWMDEHLSQRIKPGLFRVEHLLEQLNHPEKKIKGIHISGTNGKGSTLHFTKNVNGARFYSWSIYISVF